MIHSKRQIRSYGVAVGSVFFALLLMLLLDSWLFLSKSPFLLFFSAVMFSAWYGGMKPGLVATVLAGLFANFFLTEPRYAFGVDAATLGRLALFVLQGVFFSVLCDSLRSAKLRAEVNLQRFKESEQRFRLALNNPYVTVFQQDRNLRYEWIYNAQHPNPIEALIGRTDYELVLPQEVNALVQVKQKVLETGIASRQEVSLTLSGEKQYFDLLIEPVWAEDELPEDELPEGIACVAINITDRKSVEAELKRSETKFRRLVEANMFGVAIGDFSGGISYANDALLSMIGYTREELNANQIRWDELTPPDQLYLDLQAGEELRRRGVTIPFQKEYIHKEGHRVPILIGGALLDEPFADQDQIICFYLDLTSLKQAEQALQAALQRLNFHVENTPLAVIEWNRELKISRWSAAAERTFGWTAEEVLGKRMTDWQFILESDAAVVANVAQRILNGNEPQLISFNRNYTKSGTIVHCEWYNSTLTDEFGKMTSVLSLVLDVTQRKQYEQEREELLQRERATREQAESANRIKDEFLAVLSHELRSPLNPILGWSKLLRSQTLEPPMIDRALETIERNAKLQTQLIGDLLDVSRILRGKLALNVASVDLRATIEAALETVHLSAEAKAIQLHLALAPHVAAVTGDAGRLQQVIWNLLSNAVKFTPKGGQVTIRLSEDRLDSDASYVQFSITDTGKGIRPDFLPYVFDRFRQADSTTTRNFGGLGLGLAIARHIVELHGGSIAAESPGEDQGATFTVRLPVLKTPVKQKIEGSKPLPENKAINPCPLAGFSVLVVDDEADMRELITTILQQAGATVQTASSATEALEALAHTHPDIFLSDIGMPDVDGYALMRQIRSQFQPDDLVAIALTAYAGEVNQQQALAAGFQKHLAKPIDPPQLIEAIVTLLNSRSVDPSSCSDL